MEPFVCLCVCLFVSTLTAELFDIWPRNLVQRLTLIISRTTLLVKVIGQRSRSRGKKTWSILYVCYVHFVSICQTGQLWECAHTHTHTNGQTGLILLPRPLTREVKMIFEDLRWITELINYMINHLHLVWCLYLLLQLTKCPPLLYDSPLQPHTGVYSLAGRERVNKEGVTLLEGKGLI